MTSELQFQNFFSTLLKRDSLLQYPRTMQGTKRGRGSPKPEEEGKNFEGVEIGDELAKKLEAMQRDTARVELAIGLQSFVSF
jgi:hypothetical protein